MNTNFSEYLRGLTFTTVEDIETVASFRPTLYIGLGGFGCTVVRTLKAEVARVAPDHVHGFGFLGIDTHPRPVNDVLTLNEYIPLSVGVDPTVVAKQHSRYLGWFQSLCSSFKPRRIRGGADKIKCVGRLAFKNPPVFSAFATKLRTDATALREPRPGFSTTAPIKVYVISTLAGGTGSGCLLDVLATVGKRLRDIEGADFPYQAIVATPDVLIGEVSAGDLDDLYANTYATLKEIHHFLAGATEEFVDYDEGDFERLRVSQGYLPDVMHVIGDRNEAGSVIATAMEELAGIVVTYLLSEIQTPMHDQTGQPKVQDLENAYLGDLGLDNMPRSFSSFGAVRTGIPIDVVGNLFSLRLGHSTLASELREPTSSATDAANWVDAQAIGESGTDQLQDRIRQSIRDSLRVAVDVKGELLKTGAKYDDLGIRAQAYVTATRKTLEDEKKNLVDSEGNRIEGELSGDIRRQFERLLSEGSLGQAVGFVRSVAACVSVHRDSLTKEATDAIKQLQDVHEKDVELSIRNLESAVPGWWKRKNRVTAALDDFEARVEGLLTAQIDVWVKQRGQQVYATLMGTLSAIESSWKAPLDTLVGHRERLEKLVTTARLQLDQLAQIENRGPGNRFSLINSTRADTLFQDRIEPQREGAERRIRKNWLEQGRLRDTSSNTEQWLTSVVPFIVDHEIMPSIESLTFNAIMKLFYPTPADERLLFQYLQGFSAPLFWLDPNRLEPNYKSFWIIGIHPAQKLAFDNNYGPYLPGEGRIFAFFESPHEVILYQLKMGYTIHSLRGLATYESTYERLQKKYREGVGKKLPVRPIHGWPQADTWLDLIPHPDEDEALTWFVLGRAFSDLFPAAEAAVVTGRGANRSTKAGTYLYSRGSNYYLSVKEDAPPVMVGKGLIEAVTNFGLHPEWQVPLRSTVEEKIDDVGQQVIRAKLDEYLPRLEDDINTAEKTADPDRAMLLRKLAAALRQYIGSLSPRTV